MKSIVYFAGLLIASTGIAYADDQPTVVTPPSPYVEHVPYKQADLTTEAGVKDLRSRVRRAAHRVCEPDDSTFYATYNHMRCYTPTIRDAFAQVDSAVSRARDTNLASASRISIQVR